jgi:hypothetical protein
MTAIQNMLTYTVLTTILTHALLPFQATANKDVYKNSLEIDTGKVELRFPKQMVAA